MKDDTAGVNIVISFPKSGRTWLRVMLDEMGVRPVYSHDDADHRLQRPWGSLDADKTAYRNHRVVLLTRDPRDVVGSGYFQATKRLGIFSGSLSDFVRDERHGIRKVVEFVRYWRDSKHTCHGFLEISYEQLHEDTVGTLQQVLQFFGHRDTGLAELRKVSRKFRFESMRRMEQTGQFESRYGAILQPKDVKDPESYKVRRGEVGGYVAYLNTCTLRKNTRSRGLIDVQ